MPTIDDKFITAAVIHAMIDVLGIRASDIDKIVDKIETLIRVAKLPYLSITIENGVATIKVLFLDNVPGMLQLNQLLNNQFKKYQISFVLSAN